MLKMYRTLCFLLMIPCITIGQVTPKSDLSGQTGIRFESGKSWNEIQARAKAEHKYIFMDCYATWCGPCKRMSQEIFPKQRVGDYFNSHFINVAVQMDKTAKDAKDVQDWYADASSLSRMYRINDYPTYLFFSPEGGLMHRTTGATINEEEFVANAKNAMDPANQYYSVIKQYKSHAGDSAYLLRALTMAIDASDQEYAELIGNDYIESLKDPVNKENIQLIYRNRLISSCTDKSFLLFIGNTSRIDSIMGDKNYAEDAVSSVIFREQVSPLYDKEAARLNWKEISASLKVTYPKMGNVLLAIEEGIFRDSIEKGLKTTIYKDGSTMVVDWNRIYKRLKWKYPDYDFQQVFLDVKAGYCYSKGLWAECEKAAYDLMHQYGDRINDHVINNIAWDYVFVHGTSRKILKEALKWMKHSVDRAPQRGVNLDTYANLLYKLGNLREALDWEKKAIDNTRDQGDLKQIMANFDKMEKKQPTWEDNSPVIAG